MRHYLLVLGVGFAAACNVGEVPDGVAQPNVIVLDEAIAARVTLQPDGISIPTGAAGPLAGVHVGDVVVANGPQPFLRRVMAVDSLGGQLALITEPAALTDAILQGHAHSERDLLSEPVPRMPGQTELIIPIDKLALDFAGTNLIDELGVKVRVNRGTVSFRPSLDVDLQIDRGSLTSFHAILRGELEASVGLTVSSDRSFRRSFSTTLWESPAYTATQFIGIVPVVEVVRVSLVLSGEAHASVRGTVDLGSAKAKASLEAGATYADGTWRAIADPSITFETRGPSFEAGAMAGASLRLTTRVDVRFYDVAGPHLVVGTYARTELRDSSADGLSWTGRVGVDAAFGGNVRVLGKSLASYDRALFDLGRDFAPIP
ncbi:MAG: hypothetical protein M3680_26710 [Myxococcota bacterium]|nr:hypothetical protein [Myxococcota bacterium]